jgi:hypothetical protein
MNPEELKTPKPNNLPPAPQVPLPPKKDDFLIRPLRTYEDDVKEIVKKDNISTAKIMLAEQRKREIEKEITEEVSIKSNRNITRIIVSIVLIALGIGAVSGVYFYHDYQIKKQNNIPAPILITKNDFIDVDSTTKIDRTNLSGRETLGAIRNIIRNSGAEMVEKNIREIKITKVVEVTTTERKYLSETSIETEEFTSIIESRIPDQLLRNLDKNFFLGIHKNGSGAIQPFIILRVLDYEIAYNKMFEWENFLTKDIQDIFYQTLGSSQKFIGDNANMDLLPENQNNNEQQNDTEQQDESEQTEYSEITPSQSNYDFRGYRDLVLNNRDTRAILNSEDKLLFFYSFVDRNHIIMTVDVETLINVINRLNSAKLIR